MSTFAVSYVAVASSDETFIARLLADWVDDARDLLSFIDNYLPSSFTQSNLPVHLPLMDRETTKRRKLKGVKGRTLVGIGHSFGGCVM